MAKHLQNTEAIQIPNNPIPDYKRRKIFRMTLEGKGVGHIASEADVSKGTVKEYQQKLEEIVCSEIDHITTVDASDETDKSS